MTYHGHGVTLFDKQNLYKAESVRILFEQREQSK